MERGSEGKPKRGRKPKKAGPPLFVNHHEIAHDMGLTTTLIIRWIDAGKFPLPHSVRGTFRLYLRADWEHYVREGRWPSHLRCAQRRRSPAKS